MITMTSRGNGVFLPHPQQVFGNVPNSKSRLGRLNELALASGPSIWERVKLVSELLRDHEGDEGVAMDVAAFYFFPDIGGLIPIGMLLDIYRMFPEKEEWAENRYDLQMMKIAYLNAKRPTKSVSALQDSSRTSARRELELERTKSKEERFYRMQAERKVESLGDVVKRLEAENEALRLENGILRSRIDEMERTIAASTVKEHS